MVGQARATWSGCPCSCCAGSGEHWWCSRSSDFSCRGSQSSTAQQQNIFNHSQSIREGDDTGGRSAASRCTRCTTPIQASTYGGIQGLPPKESGPGRYSIQGAMEVSSRFQEISERWEDPATATIIAARRARTSLGRRKKAQFRPPEPALLRKEPKPAKVYIEIFSGCGGDWLLQ